VRLRGAQTETREQHARTYWITPRSAVVRDLTPPAIALGGIDGGQGWIGPSRAVIGVRWSAADNFGAEGIGTQRIQIAGQQRWSGTPGPGNHVVPVGLAGIGDGIHQVRVSADGGGTAGAADSRPIAIDRTPPIAALAASLAGTRATLTVGALDATSGVLAWYLRQGSPTGPIIATSADTPGGVVTDIDVSGALRSTVTWYVRVVDAAGNVADAQRGLLVLPPVEQLPNLKGVRLVGLHVGGPTRVLRRGRERLVRSIVPYGTRIAITGRLARRGKGRPGVAGIRVVLRGPAGKGLASSTTNSRGRFRLLAPATTPGLWSAVALGHPLIGGRLAVTPQLPVAITSLTGIVPAGESISVGGRVGGGAVAADRLVQLQARIAGQWRPIAQTRTGAKGRYSIGYRIRGAGGYKLEVRVVVPREGTLGMWSSSSGARVITIR
jgi:hypothetical protein